MRKVRQNSTQNNSSTNKLPSIEEIQRILDLIKNNLEDLLKVNNNDSNETSITQNRKRGRKPKVNSINVEQPVVIAKKRGRKPKVENETNQETTLTPNEILQMIQKLQDETNRVPTMNEVIEHDIPVDVLINIYGGWKEIKKLFKSHTTEEENLIALTKKLGKVPTMEDIRENNINIESLLLKYNGWKEIKNKLGLYEIYDEKLKNEILELQKSTIKSPTMQQCKAVGIDVNYLMRRFGGWKEALSTLNIDKYDKESLAQALINTSKNYENISNLDDEEVNRLYQLAKK